MKKSTVVKIIVTIFLLIVDVLLLPVILEFPLYVKEYGFNAPQTYVDNISILDSVHKLIIDSSFRNLFLAFQPLVILLIVSLYWKNVFKRKEHNADELGGPKAAGSGEFGTSRWLTNNELAKKTTVWDTTKPLKAGGVVVQREIKNGYDKFFLETSDTHSLIIGTTRSGKSRTHIIPSIVATGKAGESMLINDPKGELYNKTNTFLREQGYEIVLLDFRNPYRGNRWNPMERIKQAMDNGDESTASEAAIDLAHTIVYQRPRTGDPIWADGTKSVISALVLDIAMEATNSEQKHLTSVYNTLIELGTPIPTTQGDFVPLNEYFRNKKAGTIVKNAFGPAAIAAERTRASFYGGAATDLFLFSDPGIANLTAYSDHDLADIGRRKTAVFMIVPDEKSTRHVLASLYVDQTYQALVELANESKGNRIPVRVNCFLDEFGNMPPINGFDNKITVSAGRGIRYHLVIQDFGQLKKQYGQDIARIIKNNCHTWIYLLTGDNETADEISKKTGRYTVETQNISSSLQPKSYSHGMSSSLMGRPLLDDSEVKKNPYGRGIVFLQREHPARTDLPDYSVGETNKHIIEKEPQHIEFPKVNVPIFIPDLNSGSSEQLIEFSQDEKIETESFSFDSLDKATKNEDDEETKEDIGLQGVIDDIGDLEDLNDSIYTDFTFDNEIAEEGETSEEKVFSLNDLN